MEKLNQMRRNRRGISPLIATIILISITIAAGLTVYALVSNMVGTMSATLDIQIQSIDIVKAGSNTLIAATIKNSGNIQITTCIVTVTGDSGTATLTLGSIGPGKAASASLSNPSGLSITVGNAYPVSISVTATGSSLTKALTAICTGS
jgi:flagellin-like protein